MSTPLTLAHAHARLETLVRRVRGRQQIQRDDLASKKRRKAVTGAICLVLSVEEIEAIEVALLALPSAPQEPPQDCICDEDEIRLHMPDPRCEAPNCKAVASAPQTVSTEGLATRILSRCSQCRDGIPMHHNYVGFHAAQDEIGGVAGLCRLTPDERECVSVLRALSASAPPQGWQLALDALNDESLSDGAARVAARECLAPSKVTRDDLEWAKSVVAPPASPSEEREP